MFAERESSAFLLGDGVTMPMGILTAPLSLVADQSRGHELTVLPNTNVLTLPSMATESTASRTSTRVPTLRILSIVVGGALVPLAFGPAAVAVFTCGVAPATAPMGARVAAPGATIG